MKGTIAASSWIAVPRPNPRARVRLFCFPYGGGGASIFRTWPQNLPDAVEVCGIQLPGRENRIREAPFTDVLGVVNTLAEILRPCLTFPFAFFGHSLGAFIGFELARQLRKQNAQGPIHLFVSGQRAPQIPDTLPPLYQLPDREFIEQVHRRYDAIPQVVLQSAELMQILLPLLRADLTMNDTYVYTDDRPLDCPITCFGGQGDPETTNETLAAWREQTCSNFKLKMFLGDHFFIQSEQASVLRALGEELKVSANASSGI